MIQIRGVQGENPDSDSRGSRAIQVQIPEAQEENYDSASQGAGGEFRFRLAGLRGNPDSDSRGSTGKL